MVGPPMGRCPNCGLRCYGWALRYSRHQTCPKCGTGLEITNGKGNIGKGYSPFDAKLMPKLSNGVESPDNITDKGCREKK